MAIQKGVVKLVGAIDDFTFRQTKRGFRAGRKAKFDKEKMLTSEKYERVRENLSEFGRAGKGVTLIRDAFKHQLRVAKDSELQSRMIKVMMQVIKADPISVRGQRNAVQGPIGFFENFDFNKDTAFSSAFYGEFIPEIDRAAGILSITLPSFIPKLNIKAPLGASHCKIMSAGAEINFAEAKFDVSASDSGLVDINATTPTAATVLSNTITPNSVHPLLLVVGIQFFQVVNGTAYDLKTTEFNALTIAKAEGV